MLSKDHQDHRSELGKLQNKARNADDCQPNKVVTFKSPTGTGAVGYGGKYPGTDNNIIKTVMGSGPCEETTANELEK